MRTKILRAFAAPRPSVGGGAEVEFAARVVTATNRDLAEERTQALSLGPQLSDQEAARKGANSKGSAKTKTGHERAAA